MRFIKLLFFLFLILLGSAFTVMNMESIHIDYYFGERDIPLPLLLIATLGVGALLGVLASLGSYLRLKHQNAELRRKISLAQEELKNLRAIPIKD
jgi:putative membrane protein